MSAVLFVVLIFASCVNSAYVEDDDASSTLESYDMYGTDEHSIQVLIQNPTQHILVEEVDKNGNSAIKELELVQYDESEELREDKAKVEQQKLELSQSAESKLKKKRSFDCEKLMIEKQSRKCMKRKKKLFLRRYNKWKRKVHEILDAIDLEVQAVMREDSDATFKPRDVFRLPHLDLEEEVKPD